MIKSFILSFKCLMACHFIGRWSCCTWWVFWNFFTCMSKLVLVDAVVSLLYWVYNRFIFLGISCWYQNCSFYVETLWRMHSRFLQYYVEVWNQNCVSVIDVSLKEKIDVSILVLFASWERSNLLDMVIQCWKVCISLVSIWFSRLWALI